MRFYSTPAPNPVYVIIPDIPRYNHVGMQMGIEKGQKIEFRAHSFDSEAAQVKLQWTDEQRVVAEQHLLNHKDYLGVDPKYRIYLEADKSAPDTSTEAIGCIHNVVTSEGAVFCHERVVEGSRFCSKHVEAAETAGV